MQKLFLRETWALGVIMTMCWAVSRHAVQSQSSNEKNRITFCVASKFLLAVVDSESEPVGT